MSAFEALSPCFMYAFIWRLEGKCRQKEVKKNGMDAGSAMPTVDLSEGG